MGLLGWLTGNQEAIDKLDDKCDDFWDEHVDPKIYKSRAHRDYHRAVANECDDFARDVSDSAEAIGRAAAKKGREVLNPRSSDGKKPPAFEGGTRADARKRSKQRQEEKEEKWAQRRQARENRRNR